MINVYKVENVGCLSFLKIFKFKHSTTSTQFLKSDTTKFLMIIPTIWITELTYCQHSPAAFHLSGCVEISLFLSSLLFQGDYDILLLYDSLGGGQLGSGRSELSALDLVFLTPHFIQEVLILLGLQQSACCCVFRARTTVVSCLVGLWVWGCVGEQLRAVLRGSERTMALLALAQSPPEGLKIEQSAWVYHQVFTAPLLWLPCCLDFPQTAVAPLPNEPWLQNIEFLVVWCDTA